MRTGGGGGASDDEEEDTDEEEESSEEGESDGDGAMGDGGGGGHGRGSTRKRPARAEGGGGAMAMDEDGGDVADALGGVELRIRLGDMGVMSAVVFSAADLGASATRSGAVIGPILRARLRAALNAEG